MLKRLRWSLVLGVALLGVLPTLAASASADVLIATAYTGPGGCLGGKYLSTNGYTVPSNCSPIRVVDGLASVLVSPDGRFVYAIGGVTFLEDKDGFGIAVFSRNPTTGTLTQLPGPAGCLSFDPSCTQPLGIPDGYAVMSPDGHNLYVGATFSNGTDYRPGGILAFSRDQTTGALTALPGTSGCVSEESGVRASMCRTDEDAWIGEPTSLTVSPDGRHLYTGAVSPQDDWNIVSEFARDPATGALTPLPAPNDCLTSPYDGSPCTFTSLGEPMAPTFDTTGTFGYMTGFPPSVYQRDRATGVLSPMSGPARCYSSARTTTCTHVGGISRGRGGVTISPDGRFAYFGGTAAEGYTYGVEALRRDPASGQLTQLPGTAGCVSNAAIAGCAVVPGMGIAGGRIVISSDGRFLVEQGAVFTRDMASGALTFTGHACDPVYCLDFDALTPDGTGLYAADETLDLIESFQLTVAAGTVPPPPPSVGALPTLAAGNRPITLAATTKTIPVTLRCAAASKCTGQVILLLQGTARPSVAGRAPKHVVLGTSTFSIAAHKTSRLSVKLTAAGRKAIARRTSVKVTVVLRVTSAGHRPQTRTGTLTIRLRRRSTGH